MKKILSFILSFTLIFTLFTINMYASSYSDLTPIVSWYDFTVGDVDVLDDDALDEVKMKLGRDVLSKMANADPRSTLAWNGETEEITFTEYIKEDRRLFEGVTRTEPFIPSNSELSRLATDSFPMDDVDVLDDDALDEVKMKLGKDILDKMENADPRSTLAWNGETGETTFTEYVKENRRAFEGATRTEPFEGVAQDDSFGVPTDDLFAIIGSDGRRMVGDVDAYPFRAVVFLDIRFSNGVRSTGTGFMVSANTVLTAGHNVYNHNNGGWATSIDVNPGGIYSKFSSVISRDFRTMNAWINGQSADYDYGLIQLSGNIGNQVGWFGTQTEPNSNLGNQSIYNYGFPNDKSYGTMWSDTTGTIGSVNNRAFYHNADTYAGNSGGPIVLASNAFYAVGIHSKSISEHYNQAARVTSDVVDLVLEFGR